jgi:competence protein ComGC
MRNDKNEAGFSLIDVLFTLAIIGTLSTIAMPGLFRARSQAGTASAIGALRVINGAQLSYAITCGSGFYAPNLTALGRPAAGTTQGFIIDELGRANTIIKGGYSIRMLGSPIASSPESCNGIAAGAGTVGYKAAADSLEPNFPVNFSTNTSGAIWMGPVSLFAQTGEAVGPPGGTLVK